LPSLNAFRDTLNKCAFYTATDKSLTCCFYSRFSYFSTSSASSGGSGDSSVCLEGRTAAMRSG
jgi:hypothetical protein